ncbi:MAG: hypothetical protein ACRDF4_08115 [Rhabdochlamydiaceae bacterium]
MTIEILIIPGGCPPANVPNVAHYDVGFMVLTTSHIGILRNPKKLEGLLLVDQYFVIARIQS